jgi:hypothetical protein
MTERQFHNIITGLFCGVALAIGVADRVIAQTSAESADTPNLADLAPLPKPLYTFGNVTALLSTPDLLREFVRINGALTVRLDTPDERLRQLLEVAAPSRVGVYFSAYAKSDCACCFNAAWLAELTTIEAHLARVAAITDVAVVLIDHEPQYAAADDPDAVSIKLDVLAGIIHLHFPAAQIAWYGYGCPQPSPAGWQRSAKFPDYVDGLRGCNLYHGYDLWRNIEIWRACTADVVTSSPPSFKGGSGGVIPWLTLDEGYTVGAAISEYHVGNADPHQANWLGRIMFRAQFANTEAKAEYFGDFHTPFPLADVAGPAVPFAVVYWSSRDWPRLSWWQSYRAFILGAMNKGL